MLLIDLLIAFIKSFFFPILWIGGVIDDEIKKEEIKYKKYKNLNK